MQLSSAPVFASSHSATSRALTCPDIIIEIVEQTSPPSDGALDLQFHRWLLANLALVCHAFNGPATRALWSRLKSFFPLMHIISTFDNKCISLDTDVTYMIAGDIPPHEFARFRELGSFVQAVTPRPSECVCESDAIAPAVWPYLAHFSGSTEPLFPSLRELHWVIQENFGTELSLVVSSSLRRLTVCYGGRSTDSPEWTLSQSMLFRTIFDITRSLTHLAINDVHKALFPACLSNLSVLRMLRVVSLDQHERVDLDVLRTLSSVASLEELSMAVGTLEEGVVDFVGFPSLKRLEISILSGPALARPIFVAFSSPHLCELILRDDGESYMTTEQIFEASPIIARHVPSVTDLTLCLFIRTSNIHGADVSITTALAPLFALPLHKLSLEAEDSSVPTLTDEFFAALAQSCPQLVELSIVFPDGYMEPSDSEDGSADGVPSDALLGITPRTLLALTRGCPRLQVLQLPWMSMKGSHAGELADLECPSVLQHHPLRTLVVDQLVGVDEEDPEYVFMACARLVDKVFPDLDASTIPPGIIVTYSWERVLDGVRSCQLARFNRTSD